jgi:hypothetical protein
MKEDDIPSALDAKRCRQNAINFNKAQTKKWLLVCLRPDELRSRLNQRFLSAYDEVGSGWCGREVLGSSIAVRSD